VLEAHPFFVIAAVVGFEEGTDVESGVDSDLDVQNLQVFQTGHGLAEEESS
jgi:hypothetical protein